MAGIAEPGEVQAPPPDPEWVDRFLQDCRDQGMSGHAIEVYRSNLRAFARFCAGRGVPLVRVDRNLLRDFIRHLRERGLAFKTLAIYLSALSSFYEFLAFEEAVPGNPVPAVRKRYLRQFKHDMPLAEGRKLISVEEMAKLVRSALDPRDRAILLVLAKTGMRRGELIAINLDDLDLERGTIRVQAFKKRTNRVVFIDEECAEVLRAWLELRAQLPVKPGNRALFTSHSGGRVDRNAVYNLVVKYATAAGVHNPQSDRLEDRFTVHCARHWFTTHLRRAGMRREFIQELRGDRRKETVDIYDHIDPEELRREYLASIPRLVVE